MNADKIQISAYTGEGWTVPVESGAWRIGYLNHCEAFEKDKLSAYERHHETDEVFVLLSGQATLFIGDGDESFGRVEAIPMEPGKLYNIQKMAWHTQFMSSDCSILVIENRDTGMHNSDVVTFDDDFRAQLYAAL